MQFTKKERNGINGITIVSSDLVVFYYSKLTLLTSSCDYFKRITLGLCDSSGVIQVGLSSAVVEALLIDISGSTILSNDNVNALIGFCQVASWFEILKRDFPAKVLEYFTPHYISILEMYPEILDTDCPLSNYIANWINNKLEDASSLPPEIFKYGRIKVSYVWYESDNIGWDEGCDKALYYVMKYRDVEEWPMKLGAKICRMQDDRLLLKCAHMFNHGGVSWE